VLDWAKKIMKTALMHCCVVSTATAQCTLF
jgi:hypothetical protein